MANKSYSVDHTNVGTLLHWIEENKIGLPEMQRPFVWKSVQVRDLIDSLYRGYPIGFIVTWQNPDAALKNVIKAKIKKLLLMVNRE